MGRPRRGEGKSKLINMDSKAAKYFKAHRLEGKTKTQAVKEAGISDVRNVGNMEKTEIYERLEQKYADVLGHQMPKDEVAKELIKNIRQDSDKGAKNTAIKMLMDRVEPEQQQKDEDEKMIVILRN